MTMLACARMGAIHSVVFAGFSADALAARVAAARSKIIVTADVGLRGGKRIALHDIVTAARTKHGVEELLQAVLVWERFYDDNNATVDMENDDIDTTSSSTNAAAAPYTMQPKDVRMNVLVAAQRPYSVPVWMDAEDALFLLYTSGSTGHPKGLEHTTGGYALYAAFTMQTTFDLREGDIFACVADCGWITGHTYVVYGPLLNGQTTFLFESTPVHPNPGRYWDMIQRHRITQFYTAPTAIRLLMRYGDDIPAQYNISSVRVLGTVGEPINPEAWRWYYKVVGQQKCSVVDTYWQTETGGHVITNLPGITPMKPGSCTLPMYGIQTVILDAVSGQPVTERDAKGNLKGVLAIKHPWPGMARTCLGDHERYLLTYFKVYPGYYFTGDSAYQDQDGYTFIIGRVDDVLNVSGHRIGTAEVESALVAHALVAQAGVVGQPHEIKGQSIAAFVMLTSDATESAQLVAELKQLVRQEIGSFATPDLIVVAPTLPMTRSGKIMRRILRKIVCDETDQLGDTSTLADPSIVDILIAKVAALKK
jgi:acetyl-CoA synthetase